MKREQTIERGVIHTTAMSLAGLSARALLLTWLGGTAVVMAQPVIISQPAGLSRSLGAAATFSVTVSSTKGPVTYQWLHQDTPLLNATDASLTLTDLQLGDAGPYMVAITDAGGTILSDPALLDVNPTWTKITRDPIVTDDGYYLSTGYFTDLNNDGYLDLFMVTDRPQHNPTYLNNGDGTFTRVFEPSLQGVYARDYVYSWGDYDNDGYPDLFVPEWGTENLLYHNNGDGTFTQITDSPVTTEVLAHSSAGTWVDYDRDGDLDLYVANGAAGGDVLTTNCFYENQGDGTFVKLNNDVVRPLITEVSCFDLPVWVDIDNDGWQDLFIVETGNNHNSLYRNNGGSGFIEVTDDPLVHKVDNHWGDAAWADYDNDGDLDVFLTTARPYQKDTLTGPVVLFRNDGQGHFTRMTPSEVGPLASERSGTYVSCWGDYDNDGWLDLYIANAFHGGEDRADLLYHNNGDGTFTKVTTGSPVTELGAGFAGFLIDLNRDGFLDLFVFKHPAPDNCPSRLYLNNGNANTWLAVQCVGTVSPRFGTGAKVRVKATIGGQSLWQLRVIEPGGFANGQGTTAHFGLGDATNVEVLRIEWTSGMVQEFQNVPVEQYVTVTEPGD